MQADIKSIKKILNQLMYINYDINYDIINIIIRTIASTRIQERVKKKFLRTYGVNWKEEIYNKSLFINLDYYMRTLGIKLLYPIFHNDRWSLSDDLILYIHKFISL